MSSKVIVPCRGWPKGSCSNPSELIVTAKSGGVEQEINLCRPCSNKLLLDAYGVEGKHDPHMHQ